MNENDFIWLLKWYDNHCDGDWEHGKNISLTTIDNPGWSLTINLSETELATKSFPEIEQENSENNWLICFVKNQSFEGRCGPLNLPTVLNIFRKWVENS